MAPEERFEKLENEIKKLEHNANFRLLMVALGTLVATLIAILALFTQ